MGFLDALWHLLNFCAPSIGLGALAAGLAKLVYRRELSGVPWRSLTLWSGGASLLMLLGGLVVFGRDGKMASYAAMVVAAAITLWWRGFVRGAKR